MSLMDGQALFSDAQDISSFTVAGSPWYSTYVYDLQTGSIVPQNSVFGGSTGLNRVPGRGQMLFLTVSVRTAVTSGGSATLQVKLLSSTTSALTGSPTTLYDSGAIAKASLVVGYQFPLGYVLRPDITQRYIGLSFTVGTADLTAGKIDAFLSLDRQTAPGYQTVS